VSLHRLCGDLSLRAKGLALQILHSWTGCHAAKNAWKATAENAERAESLVNHWISTTASRLRQQFGVKDRLNALTEQIIGAAIQVHRTLGPGLLESAYEACLAYELMKRGLNFEKQKPLPVVYDEVDIDCAYRLDFVVGGEVIVEVKAVERLTHVHDAQLMSYLKLSKKRVGLLINFNVKWLVDEGLRRRVNDFPD